MKAASTSRHKELGAMLRAHRQRLSPQSLGMAVGPRRRTPGLRREEVAERCGLSVTWYTWIEQGRDVSISVGTLAALARVLRLSAVERGYVFELAGKNDPFGEPIPGPATVPDVLRATVGALSVPAYVLDRYWNACAWNPAAADLLAPWLDQGPGANLLRFVFLDPAADALLPDRGERASRLLAEFRIDYGRYLDDPGMAGLVDELAGRSNEFAGQWDAHAVLEREGGRREFLVGPGGTHAVYRQVTLDAAGHAAFRLAVLIPSGKC